MFIFVKEGQEAVFQEFEELALPLLEDYNGKLIYRLRPSSEAFVSNEDKQPYEIHFLSFESEKDFLDFGRDERRTAFMHLRNQSIDSVFMTKGIKI
ncbi:hypothetical protein [Flavobacterium faecale]|uniref:hypothetical protein n=1 Tax=Flavobacterium faecale TaxID=1355330 RepID=UPI003AAE6674